MHQGSMTAAAVEDRLKEAGRVLLALPHAGCFPAGFRTLWPAVEGGFAQRRWVPSPVEISRMDEAYRWVALIADVDERRLVLMRSLVWRESGRHVWSWNRLRRCTGLHPDTLQARCGRGIDRIVRGLNGADGHEWRVSGSYGAPERADEAGFGLHPRTIGGMGGHFARKSAIRMAF